MKKLANIMDFQTSVQNYKVLGKSKSNKIHWHVIKVLNQVSFSTNAAVTRFMSPMDMKIKIGKKNAQR